MGNIGAKVSRINADVSTVSDDQLVYSSSWPSAKILFSGLATVDAGSSHTIVTHGLGYEPMFLIYRVSGATSEFSSYGSIFDGSAVASVGVNSSELKYFASGFGSGNVSFYYIVLDIPLLTDFTADILNTSPDLSAPIGVGPGDYGIKVALDGRSVDSTDLRDFAVHSAAGNINVHRVGHGAATDAAITAAPPAKQFSLSHSLGYEPLALCYINYGANGSPTFDSGYYYMLGGVGGPAFNRFYITSTACRVEEDYTLGGFGSATSTSAIVILKEPFNTVDGYSITVAY